MIPRIAAAAVAAATLAIRIGAQEPASPTRDRPAADSAAPAAPAAAVVRDSVRRDSAARAGRRSVNVGVSSSGQRGATVRRGADATGTRRIPLTPHLIASAYANDATRDLVLRARQARFAADSSLQSYEALSYHRMSAKLGVRVLGRERLAIRTEQAARVWWSRGAGVTARITGARAVAPIIESDDIGDDPTMTDAIPIPYVPGRDRLWPIGYMEVDVNGESVLHPFAEGAEAYYRYAIADSIGIDAPGRFRYDLIEIRVTPREQRWNAVVGSIWLDRASAQIVRSAYRFAAPLDLMLMIDAESARDSARGRRDDDDIPPWLRPMLSPMRVSVSAVTQEFALQNQRWWLPISQTAEGLFEVGPIRTPVSVEERYRYERVSGSPMPSPLDSLRGVLATRLALSDSLLHARRTADSARRAGAGTEEDSVRRADRRRLRQRIDSLQQPERDRCRTTKQGERSEVQRRDGMTLMVLVPCDPRRLAASPDLPASIYDETDEVFGETDREVLRDWARSLEAAHAEHSRGGRPRFEYGIGGGLLRYNRVEGLSLGVRAERALTRDVKARGLVRMGSADLRPGAELGVAFSSGGADFGVDAYTRLAAAGDYGDPFTLGASLSALLLGRDDNFYYRSAGVELTRARPDGSGFAWRIFGERHTTASVHTHVSLAHIGGGKFQDNIRVPRTDIFGVGVRTTRSYGLDPNGWRLLADLRSELGAFRESGYARGLVDLTLSHPVTRDADLAVTGAAGAALARGADPSDTLGNRVPIEKQFYVGGPRTVRGVPPGSGIGEAFWLARAELGVGSLGFRPVAFFDLGWAGARRDFARPGKPLSGAGLGISILDGILRLDVAKAIRPAGGVRGYFYLDARF